MLAFFLLSHPRVFSAHDLVKLPPFRNSYPGSHGTHSSPFPTTVLAFVLVSKKKKYRDCLRFSRKNIYIYIFRIRFPSLASPCVELVCLHATYQYNTQHAGAFCGQFVYWCFCFRLWSRPERTHTSFLLKIYLWCIYTCHIIAWYPYQDIPNIFSILISIFRENIA